MRTILGAPLTLIALASSATACFAIVSLDPYHVAPATTPDEGGASATPDAGDAPESSVATTGDFDLKMSFLNMFPHVMQLFEYRVIDSTNFIQSRGFVVPLGSPNVVINAPKAVTRVNGPFRLDFYADVD